MRSPSSQRPSFRFRSTRQAFRALLTTGAATGIALLGSLPSVNAAGIWIGTTGEYTTATNWDNGVVPNAINTEVSNNGTIQISQGETVTTNDILAGTVSTSTTSNWAQSSGSVTMTGGWFRLGVAANSSGAYNLTGGSLTTVGQISIGEGNYRFNGVAGTAVTGTTGQSVVTVSGANTVWTNNGAQLTVGGQSGGGTNNGAGSGLLNLQGGTITNNNEFWVGENPGSVGVFNMSGGTLNVNNWIATSRNGANSTVNMTGGTINKTGGGNLTMVGNTTTPAVWNQTAGDYISTNSTAGNGNAWFGENGSATYNMSGGTFTTRNIDVGRAGGGGTGILNMQNATDVVPGGLTNGGGNGVMTGATLTMSNAGAVASIVNLNGGTLAINNIVAGAGTGAKTINFNGGLLQYASPGIVPAAALVGANIAANVLEGGVRINSQGSDLAVNANLAHGGAAAIDGGLVKTGGGTLTLGGANTYTGATNVDAPLIFSNTGNSTYSGNITIANGGGITQTGTGVTALGGTNTYTGATQVSAGVLSALTPASLPGFNTFGQIAVAPAAANGRATLALGYGGAGNFTSAQIDAVRNNVIFNGPGAYLGLDTTQAAAGSTSTYASNITGTIGFAKVGANVLALTGNNTYSGGTLLRGGLLNLASLNNVGTGGFTFNGGGIQHATGTAIDITTRAVVIDTQGATIDTNGNNVTYANAITSNGAFAKAGAGTLTLTGGFGSAVQSTQNSGNIFVQGGTLVFSGANQFVNTGGNYSSVGQAQGNVGTLNITNGATVITTNDFNVSDITGSTGTVNVDAGSTLRVNTLYVGKGNSAANTTNGAGTVGTFNQTGGTVAQAQGGADWRIGGGGGANAQAVGTYNLSGGTLDAGNSNFQVGAVGQGTLNQTGGIVNSNAFTDAGRYVGGVGVINVTGGTFNQTAGTGTLQSTAATPGPLAGNTGSKLFVGEEGTGTLNIGGTGVVNSLGGVVVGLAATGTGTVNLNTGGTLSTVYVSPTVAAGGTRTAGSSGTFNFNGGTLASRAGTNSNSGAFFQGLTTANVQAGGARVDTAAVGVTIAQALVHDTTAGAPAVDGGLTKVGANTLTLTGVNTYTGPTSINVGTLALTGTGSIGGSNLITTTSATSILSLGAPTTFGTGQALTGIGSVTAGANAVTVSGILSAGATANAGDVGNLTLATTGTLTLTGTTRFDILTAGNKDLFTATNVNLNLSGTLALNLGAGVGPGTYTLFTGLASETGNYTTVTGLNANQTATFNFTGGNYNLVIAVPEPSTWAMGVFGLGLAALWLRRRRVA